MAVRNFYLSAQADGRASEVTAGPGGKEGGMSLSYFQRDSGNILKAVTIDSWVMADGRLKTVVYNTITHEDWTIITER